MQNTTKNRSTAISIVIPLFNEKENVELLFKELKTTLKAYLHWEIIAVDDGSTDGTFEQCVEISKIEKRFKIISFRKNYGQSAAMAAGFNRAKGEIVVTLDGDLQNDPADIPRLIEQLKKGNDVAVGWRYKRKDPFLKKMFSIWGRLLRRILLKDRIHDSGCTLRAYTREVVNELDLRGEMHRYITEMAVISVFKVSEVKVNHRPRKHGKTKYNMTKLPEGFLDLLLIFYQHRYGARPAHLFGNIGLFSSIVGVLIGSYLIYIKYAYSEAIANRHLLLLAVLLVLMGVQFIILGIITDVMIRVSNTDKNNNYKIREIVK